MNEAEFVDAKWVSVPEAIQMCVNEELPLLVPQVNLLLRLLWTGKVGYQINELQILAERNDKSVWAYQTDRENCIYKNVWYQEV